MQFRVTSLRGLSVGLSVLGLILESGCGSDDGLGKRYPVYGKVTYKDKPVEQGLIAFLPVAGQEGRPATATISNGEYSLATLGNQDGGLPGNYKVTVVSKSVDDSKFVIPKYGGQPTPESRRKVAKTTKSLVPAKYGLQETSGLSYVIKAESNEANFELKD